MKGVAVNITDIPEQILVDVVEICTESVPVALTTIVTAFDVDVAGDTQLPVGVITQVTTLPLAKVVDV